MDIFGLCGHQGVSIGQGGIRNCQRCAQEAKSSEKKGRTRKGKRKRATAIVTNSEGEVLLVRDNNVHQFSLPGGGVNHLEPTLSAAVRELYEETRLTGHKAEWICDHESRSQQHVVYRIEAHGKLRIQKKELASEKEKVNIKKI